MVLLKARCGMCIPCHSVRCAQVAAVSFERAKLARRKALARRAGLRSPTGILAILVFAVLNGKTQTIIDDINEVKAQVAGLLASTKSGH